MSRFIALPVALAVLPAAAGATTADAIFAALPDPASSPATVADALEAAAAGRVRMGAGRKPLRAGRVADPAALAPMPKAIEGHDRC